MRKPSAPPHLAASVALSTAVALLFAACQIGPGPEFAKEFRLPEGDIEKGKAAFVQLECHLCHRVAGVALPPVPPGPQIDVPLGGEILRARTYAELLTAVVTPDHFVSPRWEDMTDAEGKSIMPNFNDRMTGAQLIDIVSFLQSRYQRTLPGYADYHGP